MRISVVIPTHDRRELLRRCLASVREQDHSDYEIIVVDDGSTDGTGEMVERGFPGVLYLRQERTRGPAAARNRGIDRAEGEVVAFTDDDCVVPAGWLSGLARGFRRHPGVAGVGGYQEAPRELIRTNVVARADRLSRLRRWGERADVEVLGDSEVPGLATNNVAYRRSVLTAVGGFDETFPVAAGEDADLKLRVAREGHELLYIPLGVIHHREYTVREQWRTGLRRGIGAYHFEAKHGRAPGPGRILLRLLKRTLEFLSELRAVPAGPAAITYLSRVAECVGQLQALQRGAGRGDLSPVPGERPPPGPERPDPHRPQGGAEG